MVGCDSYLSKRMISFRHMLPLRICLYVGFILCFPISQILFRGRRGLLYEHMHCNFFVNGGERMGGKDKGRKKPEIWLSRKWRNSVSHGHVTSLTLNSFSYNVRWKLPQLFIYEEKFFLFKRAKMKLFSHMKFSLLTFHIKKMKYQKGKVETCLPVQCIWAWKMTKKWRSRLGWWQIHSVINCFPITQTHSYIHTLILFKMLTLSFVFVSENRASPQDLVQN